MKRTIITIDEAACTFFTASAVSFSSFARFTAASS